MSDHDEPEEDPGEDDGGVDVDDLGDVARAMALTALGVRAAAMTEAAAVNDLPLQAAIRGPGWGAQAFRPAFDPYAAAGARIAWAGVGAGGIDLVRFDYAAPVGAMIVIDTASFTLAVTPQDVPAEAILRLEAPAAFAPADADGWRSTAPEIPVQRMTGWRDRIDALERGNKRALMIFKLRGGARAWAPSAIWF